MQKNISQGEKEVNAEEDILRLAQEGKLFSSEGMKVSEESVRFMQYILGKEKELGRKMTHEEIEEQKTLLTNQAKLAIDEALENGETSRNKLGLCKNDDCYSPHRHGSAYCQACSDKWHAEHDGK